MAISNPQSDFVDPFLPGRCKCPSPAGKAQSSCSGQSFPRPTNVRGQFPDALPTTRGFESLRFQISALKTIK